LQGQAGAAHTNGFGRLVTFGIAHHEAVNLSRAGERGNADLIELKIYFSEHGPGSLHTFLDRRIQEQHASHHETNHQNHYESGRENQDLFHKLKCGIYQNRCDRTLEDGADPRFTGSSPGFWAARSLLST